MVDSITDLKSIFGHALAIAAPADREAYLDQACAGNAALRAEVEALLEASADAGHFLESPPRRSVATVDEPPLSERPGTVIGPYKLIEEIGEGGMGTVWMAQQTEPVKRLVAVKLIKPGMDSKQVLARFEAERQALALMDHPNIAKVLDGGTTSAGRPFFVMDLVKGVPITKYCDEHHLTPRQRLELFVPVCQAVQHAHQKGIIHRDIKPSNVLVALYDGKPVPKVIDFGVAKAAGQPLTDKTLVTGFGHIVGTLEYMSPEQAEVNQLDIDTRGDIYSLGVLLYELLTGTTPLEHKRVKEAGLLEALRIIREEETPRPSTRLSTVDELPTIAANRGTEPKKLSALFRGELDWIVLKALAKDRNRRYESASAFALDVQRHLADEPVLACPPSVGYRLGKFVRRNKTGLAVAGLVLAFLVILGAGAGWALRDREAREQRAALESARKLALTEEGIRQALDRAGHSLGELHTALKKPGGVQELLNQPARWELFLKTAQAELTQAKRLMTRAEGNLDADVTADLDRLERQLVAEEADYRLALRLENIRLEAGTTVRGKFFNTHAEREYARAFAAAGLAVEPGREEEVAAQVGQSGIKYQLLAALDDWARTAFFIGKQDELWRRLLAVARLADPDLWRNQVRDPARWKNRESFLPLADQAQQDPERFRQLTPQMLVLISRALPDEKAAEAWLRKAQALHPADFWINFDLAVRLQRRKGHEQEAIGYYRAALAVRPENAAVYNNLGNALSEQKDLAGAIDAYKKALAIDRQYAAGWVNLGDTLFESKDWPGAIEAYRNALAIDKDNAPVWNNLGVALVEMERWPAAVDAFRNVVAITPEDADGWINLGGALRHSNDLPGAIEALNKAIALNKQDPVAWYNLGVTLAASKDFPGAIRAYTEALAIDSQDAEIWTGLGNTLRDSKDLPGAIDAYKKAIAIDPQSAAAHNALAWLLATCSEARFRDLSQAVALAKKAVELEPNNARYANTLGVAHYRTRDWKAAIAALEKSMELRKGGDSNDWFFLAMALWKLGDKPKAREWHDRAVQWMDQNQPKNEELRRFRAEAAELLELNEKK